MADKNLKSYLMLITSMLIYGTIGIFRRFIPLSSGMLAFTRGLLGSAFLLLFMRLSRRRASEKISVKTLLLLVLTGALIGFNWIFLFEAYNYTSVATATMCYYMQPTIVILLSPLFLHERLTRRRLLCAAAAVVGMIFVSGITGGAAGTDARSLTGVFFGLGAAALYAAVIILNKKITLDDAYRRTAVQLAGAAVTLMPYLLLTEDFSAIHLNASSTAMVLLVGLVHTGFAYALYFGSMKRLKAQSIAVLSYIDPVFALLLSAAVLHESLSPIALIGTALIIGSALVSELGPAEKAA